MTMRYENKNVLVVGGNSGIGLACAKAFVKEGARVLISGRNPETLASAAKELGPDAVTICADIGNMDGIEFMLSEVNAKVDRLDVLFISAGSGKVGGLEMTEELWDETIGINMKGSFFTVQKALPLLVKGSAVLLTSSVAWLMGPPNGIAYAASKAGVRSLARSLAHSLVDQGIRVNCVTPGPIDTPLTYREGGFADPEAALKMMKDLVPMKRIADADEMAGPVLFLCSNDASFVTGVDLLVDGGMMSL